MFSVREFVLDVFVCFVIVVNVVVSEEVCVIIIFCCVGLIVYFKNFCFCNIFDL